MTPLSIQLIDVRHTKRKIKNVLLFESLHGIQRTNLLTDACVLTPKTQRKSVVKIVSPSHNTVTLRSGMIIASIQTIDNNSIFAIKDSNKQLENKITPHEQGSIEFDDGKSDLTRDQKNTLIQFLKSNRDVFATNLSELGATNIYSHKIKTGNNPQLLSGLTERLLICKKKSRVKSKKC